MTSYPVFFVKPTPLQIKNTVSQRADNTELGSVVSNVFKKNPNLLPINTATGTIINFNFTNATGTNVTCSKINIISDYSSTVDAEQLTVQGTTNPNNQLYFGYHTNNNYGSVQARTQGVSLRPLLLNPLGGNVGINISNPSLINSNALYVNGNIFASGTITPSDYRLKTNITDASTVTTLEKINNIQLKKYDYIDNRNLEYDSNVYGVIAQQVKEILPEAINIMTMVIPSIMQYTKYVDIENVNSSPIYTLYLENNHNMSNNDKIRIMNTWDTSLKNYTFSEDVTCEIISDKVLRVCLQNTEFKNYNKLFIYGHEVNDFHAIDKSQLFTPLIGCVQELSKLINTQNKKIDDVLINTQNKKIEDSIINIQKTNIKYEQVINELNLKIDRMKSDFEKELNIKLDKMKGDLESKFNLKIDNITSDFETKFNSTYSNNLLKKDNKMNELQNSIVNLKNRIQSLELDKKY
jgi:hypothetical protein